MSKYIDAEKLIKSVSHYQESAAAAFNTIKEDADYYKGKIDACEDIQKSIISLQQEQQEVDLSSKVTFYCIGKKVTISVQELINYYIDRECCDVAYECGI